MITDTITTSDSKDSWTGSTATARSTGTSSFMGVTKDHGPRLDRDSNRSRQRRGSRESAVAESPKDVYFVGEKRGTRAVQGGSTTKISISPPLLLHVQCLLMLGMNGFRVR